MERHKPKVIDTCYAILINGQVGATHISLSDARKEVRSLSITDEIKEVQIVKQTTSHTLVDIYTPKVTKTLSVEELDWN